MGDPEKRTIPAPTSGLAVDEAPRPPGGQARQRAIVFSALGVAIIIVLAAILEFSAPAGSPTVGGCCGPHGVGFAVGNPTLLLCGAMNIPFQNGCRAGDHLYDLTVESSPLEMGNVAFRVQTSAGTVDIVTGGDPGFGILNSTGAMAASWTSLNGSMAMPTSAWTYSIGVAATTPLTNLYTIVVDLGSADPMGQGLTFSAVGVGSYSGTTSALALP